MSLLLRLRTSGISGSANLTEADDTVSASAILAIKAALNATEADDTGSAAGALKITGAGSGTEADDTASAAGALRISGSANLTEADDTVSASGALKITGAANLTDASDTATATGALKIAGALNTTDDADTVSGRGRVRTASPQAALRARLRQAFTALPYVEILNANPKNKPAGGFVAIDFPGGYEERETIGQAGLIREYGLAMVHLFGPSGRGPDFFETHAETIAGIFRNYRATVGTAGQQLKVDAVDPPDYGPGSTDGRFFRATIAVEFKYDNYQ